MDFDFEVEALRAMYNDACDDACDAARDYVVDALVLRTDAVLPYDELDCAEYGISRADIAREIACDVCTRFALEEVQHGAPMPHVDPTTLLIAWERTIEAMAVVCA